MSTRKLNPSFERFGFAAAELTGHSNTFSKPSATSNCSIAMARNISFALTTQQFRDRTKTVTRRKGWKFLKAGDMLIGCVKCMGLQPGEKIERLGQIRVVDVRREPLSDMCENRSYGKSEARREGFPALSGWRFVEMFCSHMGGDKHDIVTRIEFEYVD